MTDINQVNIRRIDPASLMVFLSMMRHRKGTKAAEELSLTQPAVSHALNRMREVYGDPLFLRRSHGMEPTAVARELEPKIREVVNILSLTLAPSAPFDPSDIAMEFRLAAFDFELATILPELVSRLQELAPRVSVQSFQFSNEQALQALLDGRIDLVVGYFEDTFIDHPSLTRERLYSERYVAVAQNDHPLFTAPLTLEAFAGADHLLVSPSGYRRHMVDHALQLAGLGRRVRTVVPSLFTALAVLGRTNLIASLPEKVAKEHAGRFGLTHRELPIADSYFGLDAVTHERDANSAAHQWMVQQINETAQAV
ncbi:MAG: LysR family transcriptional regulator [Pseudomonadota bacterium]